MGLIWIRPPTRCHSMLLSRLLSNGIRIRLVTAALLLLLAGASGCSQLMPSVQNTRSKTIQTAQAFQAALTERYNEENISTRADYTTTGDEWVQVIEVQFVNTPFNEKTARDRSQLAEEVARLAEEHFALSHPQDVVSVSFVNSSTYGVLTYNHVIDSYTLHVSDLAQTPPRSSEANNF